MLEIGTPLPRHRAACNRTLHATPTVQYQGIVPESWRVSARAIVVRVCLHRHVSGLRRRERLLAQPPSSMRQLLRGRARWNTRQTATGATTKALTSSPGSSLEQQQHASLDRSQALAPTRPMRLSARALAPVGIPIRVPVPLSCSDVHSIDQGLVLLLDLLTLELVDRGEHVIVWGP